MTFQGRIVEGGAAGTQVAQGFTQASCNKKRKAKLNGVTLQWGQFYSEIQFGNRTYT